MQSVREIRGSWPSPRFSSSLVLREQTFDYLAMIVLCAGVLMTGSTHRSQASCSPPSSCRWGIHYLETMQQSSPCSSCPRNCGARDGQGRRFDGSGPVRRLPAAWRSWRSSHHELRDAVRHRRRRRPRARHAGRRTLQAVSTARWSSASRSSFASYGSITA